MRTPLILCAAVALVAAVPMTSAATTEPEAATPRVFTVHFQPAPAIHAADLESVERPDGSRLTTSRGSCWRPRIEEPSDERLDGRLTYCLDEDRYFIGDASFVVKTGTFRIENEAGAWQGERPITVWQDPSTGEKLQAGDAALLVGEGGYEGLYAIMTFLPDWSDIRGIILDGAPPVAPTPPID